MRPARVPLYALKFLIELVGWAGTGILAFQVTGNWVIAIVVPIVVVVLWALFIAPKAPRRLPLPLLVTGELLVFAAATTGLILAGWMVFGIVFAALVIPVEIVLVATRSYDLR